MRFSTMSLRLIILLVELLLVAVATPHTKPANDCPRKCGEVQIPYPFGTRDDCYLKSSFLITCDHSFNPPKPFLRNSTDISVTNITQEGQLHIIATNVARSCYDRGGMLLSEDYESLSIDLREFTISKKNKFTVIGCDSYAYVLGFIGEEEAYSTGCTTECRSLKYVKNGSCNGQGCCHIEIPQGLKYMEYRTYSFSNHTNISEFNPCTYAFAVEQGQFNFSSDYLSNLTQDEFPMVLDWSITRSGTCEKARTLTDYACKENADCYNPDNGSGGYLCKCNKGYQGNPYLSNPNGCRDIDECKDPNYSHNCTHICINEEGSHRCECPKGYYGDGKKWGEGCQDIDECKDSRLNNCTHICDNTLGSYKCICPNGYEGDGRKDGKGCRRSQFPVVYKVALGIGIFFVVLILSISWLYLVLKRRKFIRQKEKFFKQNGGYLLRQQLSIKSGSSDTAKIFTAEELMMATGNYADDRVLGKGGHGTVYKGVLLDKRSVAIKKSKIVDQSQIEQFINEVVVLSQINNKHVVRLLGCCLETEVPLLVYEFVSNGTLFEHIHNQEKSSKISWGTRLKVAAETAGVLSYLHSVASTPIIHRDVKSTNILLDDEYNAKVSDFGASKLVPADVTQFTTMVQGTLGYLDPEYLQTSQLTEKSDVYSFGVVLVELLTGKKPILFVGPEKERNWVNYFLSSLKEGRLFQIVESHMVNDENMEEVREVAELAQRCLRVKGEERPPMMEVAMELEGFRMKHRHMWDKAKVINPEETEPLLFETSGLYQSGDGSNTTAGYDSINNKVVFDVDGR